MTDLESEVLRLRRALDKCMVGGNHLASVLIDELGADFVDKYPVGLNHELAKRGMRATDDKQQAAGVYSGLSIQVQYELWCCWNAIMQARDMMEAKAN